MQHLPCRFHEHGEAGDRDNLRQIVQGVFVDSDGKSKTLDELVTHPHAKTAQLLRHHVLALRLYTTSSFARVNDPLRRDPPQQPHPFAATTFFIDEGIRKLRVVAANRPDAHETRTFWRGMKDVKMTEIFLQRGGTEFACVSCVVHSPSLAVPTLIHAAIQH